MLLIAKRTANPDFANSLSMRAGELLDDQSFQPHRSVQPESFGADQILELRMVDEMTFEA
jgi:hypothetical protein